MGNAAVGGLRGFESRHPRYFQSSGRYERDIIAYEGYGAGIALIISGPPPATQPRFVILLIRPEEPADRAAVRLVVEAAFPTPAEAALVDRLRDDGDVVISLVAGDADGVVGHVLFSRLIGGARVLGLAPVSILPARQRAGIGSLLIRQGLAAAAAAGWEAVVVLGDPAFYRRFGFDPDLAAAIVSPYAGPHLMALTLTPDAPRLVGRLDYPPAFAALT